MIAHWEQGRATVDALISATVGKDQGNETSGHLGVRIGL